MQVQPIPRNSRKEGKDKDGEYQHFIKKNFKIVKEEIKKGRRSDPTLGEVMTEVARRYRVVKEKVNGEEDLTKEKQELIVLESSDGEDDVGVDNVVEDLDALSLK